MRKWREARIELETAVGFGDGTALSGGPESDSPAPSPSGRAASQSSIEAVTTEQGLASLEDDWNRLSDTAALPNAFMTFDWFRAWHQRLTQGARDRRRLHVLVIRKGGSIAGISPLIRRTTTRFGWVARKVEFVGGQADYNDLVLGSDSEGQAEVVADFLAATSEQWDLVDLRMLRETGSTLPQIQGALARAGLVCRVLPEKERCPYRVIDASGSEMARKFSHGFRNVYRRIERMKEEGLCVRIIENPQDEPGLLAKLIALDGQKQVGGKLSQPFVAVHQEVFQSLFDTLGPRGWLYVALMELRNRPLAFQFGFRCGKKLWCYQTAYDRAFSKLSPGVMLIPALLDYGLARGYSEYDFLRGEEAYKTRWATGFHQTYRLLIWSKHWTSRVRAFVYLDLKRRVCRLFGKGE
jgi:CelD/BcsL family acetyltransferase involved in cellulose biosynthesis